MTARPRPGGRTARNKAAVFEATANLLTERGHQSVSMTDIAARAGVAVTSLYRRWGDVHTLMMAVAVDRLIQERPLPDTGSLRGDLRTWARTMAAGMARSDNSAFFRTVIATVPPGGADSPQRHSALKRRREQMEMMLERARRRGEKTPEVDDLIDYLLAPLYMRVLFGTPPTRAFADRLVERLIGPTKMLATSGSPPRPRRR